MEWKRTIRTVRIVVICSGAPLMAAQASPGCEAWNTEDYFRPATVDGVRGCLEAGADPMARNGWSVTPLHQAAASNLNPAVIRTLLAAGADPNARDFDKQTPLHWAARYNENPAVTQALLEGGADVHAWGWSITPLHQAAEFNENPAVIQALLAAGADPNAGDGDNETPLGEVALNNPNPEVYEAFVGGGAAMEVRKAWSITPLHRAAGNNGNPMVIQALLAASADPEALDAWNSTPLRWARLRNNVAVIDFLLSNGQSSMPSAQDCGMWHTDVFFRTATVHHIQACLAAGADPNTRTNWGNAAPLHLARSAAAVRALLAAGADLEAGSRGGPTPLYVAVAGGDREVIKALLEAGADPLSEIWKGEPRTPLELAGWDP